MKKILLTLLILFTICIKSYAIELKEANIYLGEKVIFEFFDDNWVSWKYYTVKGKVIAIAKYWRNDDINLIIKVIEPINFKNELYVFPIYNIKEIKNLKE